MRNGVVYQYSVTTITGTDIHDLAGLVPAVYSHPLLDINQVAAYSVFSTETIYENTFSDLKIGFDARFSASTVRNNDFNLDTDPGSVGTTRGITVSGPEELNVHNNTIMNGYKGIYVMRSYNPIRISENILERSLAAIGHTGIEVIALGTAFGQASELNDNKIEIANGYGATGISLAEIRSDLRVSRNKVFFATAETPQPYNTGIRGHSVFGATFAYDTVTASAGYRETLFSSGIRLTNSAYNQIFCSIVNNLSRGIHLAGPSEQTRLLTNRIMEAEVGFVQHGPAMMGVQVHHENQWVGDYSGQDEYGALISGPAEVTTAQMSQFIVNPMSSNTGTLPDPIGPPSVLNSWFDEQPGEGPSCNFDPPLVPVLPPVDSLDARIRKELNFSDYNDETTW